MANPAHRRPWLIIGMLSAISACLPGDETMCSTDTIAEETSPDGRWKAVSFYRGCGALADEVTAVSILQAGAQLPNERGNIFRYVERPYAHRDSAQAAYRPPSIQWGTDARLIITYDSRADVTHRVVLFNTIPIQYRTYE